MISLLLVAPSTEVVAMKKQCKDEIIKCKKVVPLNQSYARVIKGKDQGDEASFHIGYGSE